MTIPYDEFVGAFLSKISEYQLLSLDEADRDAVVDGYLKKALSNSTFRKVCPYDFVSGADDEIRTITIDIDEAELAEIVDIVADGMICHWLKPYVYQQENLQNVMNTRDFTMYSPAELLLRVGNAYTKATKEYTQAIREYSYNHGDLSSLHL